MANQNDFLPFADAGGANVITQPTYVSLPARTAGFSVGTANSQQLNKVWRQASVIASQIAQFIVDNLAEDVLDDGNTATILDQLKRAIAQGSTVKAISTITASTTLTITRLNYRLVLNRTAAPAAMAANLPADAAVGQDFVVVDITGNLSQFPVTVTPPSGTIRGQPTWIMNEDFQAARFAKAASSPDVWTVE